MVMLLRDVTLRKGATGTPGGWCKSAAFRSHSEGQTLLHSGLRAQLEKDFQKRDKDLQNVCSHNKTSFPSWIPCAWEKACGYLPSICMLIAFIYGRVIVWWPFVFFWQWQWLFCCNINQELCPWENSRSFSQHSGHKHWADCLPGCLCWPTEGQAAPALPRMLTSMSSNTESCSKDGPRP